MAHDVFVSYSSSDKPIADAVCATLEKRGVRCWIAPRDILPGLDWGAAIVDAIAGSKLMVLVFSGAANKSPQIKREVERAVHHGLTIVPLRIQDVPLGKTLEYFISSSHWLDAYSPPVEAHLDRLAETVQVLLSRRPTATGVAVPRPPIPPPPEGPLRPTGPAPVATAPPRSAVSPKAIAAIAAAALLVGLGALLASRGHSPKIDGIQFPASILQGQRGNGVLRFSDKKGDAAVVNFEPVQGASFRPWTMELEGMKGRTAGDYGFWLSTPLVEHVVLRATLVDESGKKSEPVTFAFDVQPAPRAAAPRLVPSPRSNRRGFEIQAPNGMKFKVN